jgi:hypothetical protein
MNGEGLKQNNHGTKNTWVHEEQQNFLRGIFQFFVPSWFAFVEG